MGNSYFNFMIQSKEIADIIKDSKFFRINDNNYSIEYSIEDEYLNDFFFDYSLLKKSVCKWLARTFNFKYDIKEELINNSEELDKTIVKGKIEYEGSGDQKVLLVYSISNGELFVEFEFNESVYELMWWRNSIEEISRITEYTVDELYDYNPANHPIWEIFSDDVVGFDRAVSFFEEFIECGGRFDGIERYYRLEDTTKTENFSDNFATSSTVPESKNEENLDSVKNSVAPKFDETSQYEYTCSDCGKTFTIDGGYLNDNSGKAECLECLNLINVNPESIANFNEKIYDDRDYDEDYYEDDLMTISLYESGQFLRIRDGITEIPTNAFSDLKKTYDIKVIIPNSVKKICDYAFEDFYPIFDWAEDFVVCFSDGIEYFGKRAFAETKVFFRNLTFKNAIIIEEECFYKHPNFKFCTPSPNLEFGKSLKSIGDRAFFNCRALKSVTIQNKDTKIGKDAFANCPILTIIAPKDSYAEKYAHENQIKFKELENRQESEKVNTDIQPENSNSKADISAQVDSATNELEGHSEEVKKSEEAQDAKNKSAERMLNKVIKALGDRESANETLMFAALIVERILGNPNKTQKTFCKYYGDDFPGMKNKEIMELQKAVKQKMKNGSFEVEQTEKIRDLDFDIRYYLTALNLFNASLYDNPIEAKEFAIIKSNQWFTDEELTRVEELLCEKVESLKQSINEQLSAIDEDWTDFKTAKKFLEVNALNSWDSKDYNEGNIYCLKQRIGALIFTVRLKSGFIAANLLNYMAWYWNVEYRDIWDAALKNFSHDEEFYKSKNEQKSIAISCLEESIETFNENPIKKVVLSVIAESTIVKSGASSGENDWEYTVYKNGTICIKKYIGTEKSVLMPSTINGKKISKVHQNTFRGKNDVSLAKEIYVPAEIAKACESNVFNGLSNLEKIIFLDGANVTWLNISHCENLKVIEVPESSTGLPSISYCPKLEAFYIPKNANFITGNFDHCCALCNLEVDPANPNYCSDNGSLYDIKKNKLIHSAPADKFELSSKVKELSYKAFAGNVYLKEILIPDSVKTISNNVFEDCTELKKAVVEGGGVKLPEGTFSNCKNLEEVRLNKKIHTIESRAFYNCSSLKKIVLSPNTKKIASDAFSGCSSLESVTIPKTFANKVVKLFSDSPNVKFIFTEIESESKPDISKPKKQSAPQAQEYKPKEAVTNETSPAEQIAKIIAEYTIKITELEKKQNELKEQKATLGFFKGKQKRQLQAEIDEIEATISNLKNEQEEKVAAINQNR